MGTRSLPYNGGWTRLGIVLVAILVAAGGWHLSRQTPQLLQFEVSIASTGHPLFPYDAYARVLKTYVNAQAMVNYKVLKAQQKDLDAFVPLLGRVDPDAYNRWSEKERIAFWVNAYNALTLAVIITHYPIQSSYLTSLVFPKNSIRQIPGVWDRIQFSVMGRKLVLNDIEHVILRRQFNEPRIHLALVCASIGCPSLRNEPYTGDRLDAQLDDQARRFLKDFRKFRIDRHQGRVHLSSIFKWFGGDFLKTYGTDEKFAGSGRTERAVLHFVSRYLDEPDRQYLVKEKYSIAYLDYDWSLNGQDAKQAGM